MYIHHHHHHTYPPLQILSFLKVFRVKRGPQTRGKCCSPPKGPGYEVQIVVRDARPSLTCFCEQGKITSSHTT